MADHAELEEGLEPLDPGRGQVGVLGGQPRRLVGQLAEGLLAFRAAAVDGPEDGQAAAAGDQVEPVSRVVGGLGREHLLHGDGLPPRLLRRVEPAEQLLDAGDAAVGPADLPPDGRVVALVAEDIGVELQRVLQ